MPKRETRSAPIGEIQTDADNHQYFEARVCSYNVPDTYKTSWSKGVFTRSLEKKLPTAVFSHDWTRPIGKVVSYTDTDEGLNVRVQLADSSAVPDARMVQSLLADGIMDEFSFAFIREAEQPDTRFEGVTQITEARMDEISLVLRGSVPGTKVLSLRSEGETISKHEVADLFVKFSNGDIDLADALFTLKGTRTEPGTGEGSGHGDDNNTEFNTPMPTEPSPQVDPKDEPQPDEDEKDVLQRLHSMSRSRK